MSMITSFSMFFLSFFPLWLSVIFIDVKSICEGSLYITTEAISMLLILITGLLSVLVLIKVFDSNDTNGSNEYKIISAAEEKTLTSEFLLSYILPLFAFDFTLWHEVFLFLVFFGVFSSLCLRHKYFSVNIVLEIMRYRFYRCVLEIDGLEIEKTVITREILPAKIKNEITVRSLNNDYVFQVTSPKNNGREI